MGCAAGPELRPRVGSGGEQAPRGAPAALTRSVAALRAAPPAGLRRLLLLAQLGRAAGTQPAWRSTPGPRARTSTGPSPRARGDPPISSAGPRRAGTLLGALLLTTRVPLSSLTMSSVFGKPRAGSGPQSAPLEVNLAILGRRGAGKSGELGGWGGAKGKGLGGDVVDLLAGRLPHWLWGLPAPRWVGSDSVIFFFASVSLLLGALSTLSSALPSLICPVPHLLSFSVCDTSYLSPLCLSLCLLVLSPSLPCCSAPSISSPWGPHQP